MKFDDILVEIGVFGKYQKVLGVLLYLCAIPLSWHAIAQVFLAAKTDHWCAVQGEQLLNCSRLDLAEPDCLDLQKELTIPFTLDEDGNAVYSTCERFMYTRQSSDSYDWGSFSNVTDGSEATSNETVSCDAGWAYDRSQYKTTVIQDFELVCARADLAGLGQSVYFAGFLCGSLVWGSIADWIGRRRSFFLSVALACISATATSFMPSFTSFIAVRFFVAASIYGIYLMAFVIISEIVGPAYRTQVGTWISVGFAGGYIMLSFLAYLLREWRHLQLALSLPIFLLFTYLWFLPESPRWLISKKRFKEAEKIIGKIAKVNGTKVPENLFAELREMEDTESGATKSVFTRQPTHIDLFRTPNMRMKTLNQFFIWFVNGFVYYGLSLSTSSLGIDPYIAAFVSGAVDIPGFLTSWFVMQRWGRRLSLCSYLVLAGSACLITSFIPPGIEKAVVAMVGKFAVAGSFNIIYTFSVELYPTPIRSIGIGMSSMSARLSSILAPLILVLSKYWTPLPVVVFGSSAVLAGALTLLLPETLNHHLPETIEEGEEFGKSKICQLKMLCRKPSKHEDNSSDKVYKRIPSQDPTRDATGLPADV